MASQKIIDLPIEEPLAPNSGLTIDLSSTGRGGPMPGYLKRYWPLDAVIVKNFDGAARLRLTVNGESTIVPTSTTESINDVPPSSIIITNLGSEEVAAEDVQVNVMATSVDQRDEERSTAPSLASAAVSDLVPFGNMVSAITHGGQGHGQR